jgi:hypothetical protein
MSWPVGVISMTRSSSSSLTRIVPDGDPIAQIACDISPLSGT